MPRFSTRLAFLSALALLGLAGCAPMATASVSPTATATTPPLLTTSPTLASAPTPTNVPAGWSVMDTPHFSIAYPQGWTPDNYPQQDGSVLYTIEPPNSQQPPVDVTAQEHAPGAGAFYCAPSNGFQRATLAGAPMIYGLVGEEGGAKRQWDFVDAQGTGFILVADDTQSGSAIQAQDDAILATFRPDNATPWTC